MENNLAKLFSKRFRASDEMPAEKPFTHVIKIDVGTQVIECGLLSNGTFVVISGPTGVGKSTLMAMIAAATWKGEHANFKYKGKSERKRTLWIDTEMAKTDFTYFQRDVVMKMMDLETEEDALWAINLTWIKNIEDKRNMVYELFTALGRGATIHEPESDEFFDLSEVGLVIFDGIVDIVPNTTDETFAKDHIEIFKHFVEKSDVPMLTVLHSDKKGTDLRGTFGTFLGQKASGSMMMKSAGPGEPTTIRAHKGVRGTRPFRPFEMMWDQVTGVPYIEKWEESIDELKESFKIKKPGSEAFINTELDSDQNSGYEGI
jgi:KaiC/GvpD/RAD55 family RecA-like ATPase